MATLIDFLFSFEIYVIVAFFALLSVSGPIMVKSAKERLKKEEVDEDTMYIETALMAVFLATIWPITIGVFIIVGVLRGMAATMKALVKLSS